MGSDDSSPLPPPPVKHAPVSSFIKGFSGSVGGVAEAVCLQPMDVIKTRLQLDRTGKYTGIVQTGKVSGSLRSMSGWGGMRACAGV